MVSPHTYQPVLKLIWQSHAYCQGHLHCVHFLPLSNAGLSLLFSKAAFWWSVFAITLAGSEIPRETGLWARLWSIILIVLTGLVKPAQCRWPYFLAGILDWISAAGRGS